MRQLIFWHASIVDKDILSNNFEVLSNYEYSDVTFKQIFQTSNAKIGLEWR